MTLPDGAPAEVAAEPRNRDDSTHWLRLVAACAADPHDPEWLLDVLGLTPVAGLAVRRLARVG